MELLIAILFALGFNSTAQDVANFKPLDPQEQTQLDKANVIIDKHQYHYDAEGGIVIEDGVDPNN